MKRMISTLAAFITGTSLYAQSTYIPNGTDEYRQVERMEAMVQGNNPYFMTSIKPLSRWQVVKMTREFNEDIQLFAMSGVHNRDKYNIQRLLSLNGEWVKPASYNDNDGFPRRPRPVLGIFYSTPQNLLLFSDEKYFISVNPVLHLHGMLDEYSEDLGFVNMRGAEVRGRLFNTVGFYAYAADNQERVPRHINRVGNYWTAYPGFSDFTGGQYNRRQPYDAFMARGYVDFPIVRDKVEVTFGFDKNFIGDGMRSMILSDMGAPYTFLRMRYHFGPFFYQNLFMEHMQDYPGPRDTEMPKKYTAIHFLGYKVNKKIELGLVETTNYDMYRMQLPMFNPLILVNSTMAALDNNNIRTSLGLTKKIYWARNVQSYGQINIQSLDFKSIADGSWKNQYAYQLGIKYFDVAAISQLDLQVEWNGATPFMYSANKKTLNFSHYNQPLAHPLESAFTEFIARVNYQPIDRLQLEARAIISSGSKFLNGSGVSNNGSSIFMDNSVRSHHTGFKFTGDGSFRSSHFVLSGGYEFFPNMFIDGGIHYIRSNSKRERFTQYNDFFVYTGFRINAPKRMYDWNQ